KSDAELADEIRVFGSAFAEGLEKRLRAGVGDRTEIFNKLGAGHADAEILNRNRLRLVVRGDVDLEVELFVVDVFLGELEMTEFLEGVRGVGHQLAHENFFFRVERVDDDIEQLLDFGLELE